MSYIFLGNTEITRVTNMIHFQTNERFFLGYLKRDFNMKSLETMRIA